MNNRMFGFFAVAVAMAIFPAIIFGDRTADGWSKWVYDFQTIIGGTFAIFAAYMTVQTMRETDDRQESRHQELMRLNLRRDLLKVRRAAHPQLEEIQECARDLIEISNIFDRREYADVIRWIDNHGKRFFVIAAIKHLKDVCAREQLEEVKPLLDQKGYRSFQLVKQNEIEISKAFEHVFSDLENTKIKGMPIIGRSTWVYVQLTKATAAHLNNLNESIVRLVEEFQ